MLTSFCVIAVLILKLSNGYNIDKIIAHYIDLIHIDIRMTNFDFMSYIHEAFFILGD